MGPSHKTGDNLLACEKKSMWVSPIYLYKIFKSCRSPWQVAEHSGKLDTSKGHGREALKEKNL
jgi:hypothetical protein